MKRMSTPLTLILAGAALCAAPAFALDGSDARGAGVEVARLLRASREVPDDELDALRTELAGHVPAALTSVSSILATRRVPALGEEGEQILSEPQTELLLAATSGLARQAVEDELARLLEAPDVGRRDAAIRLLAATGTGRDLPRLWSLAVAEEEEQLVPRLEAAALWGTIRLLRAAPEALTLLPAAWRKMPPALTPMLLDSVGTVGDARALPLIEAVLGDGDEHSRLAIAQVARLALIDPTRVSMRLVVRVRSDLVSQNREEIKAAAVALARLGDTESTSDLIALIESGDRGVDETILWALRELTGMRFPGKRDLWRHWLRTEVDWYERQRPALVESLRTGGRAKAGAALRELAKHGLHRHKLSLEAASALEGGCGPETALTVCETLKRLDSMSAAPVLLALHADTDDAVAAAAGKALCSITGHAPQSSYADWQELLEPVL
ncbi:MAG: hypothetical protein GY711_33830 [bacterium]|nr:hypothetical protein [bacterium]